MSIDSEALLAKYDSSSADFFYIIPIFYKYIKTSKSPYLEYKIGGIIDVLVLARVEADVPHVHEDDGELLQARVVHQTEPECVTLELNGHDLYLLLVFNLDSVALFGFEGFFTGFHLFQLLETHLSQFFINVYI